MPRKVTAAAEKAAPEPRARALPKVAPASRGKAPGPSKAAGRDLAAVALRFKNWKPAHEVLVEVEAVPTCFPQVNRVSRVGGWPTARFTLVHGPSNEGKTTFAHGLGGSFLARGHFYGLIDAEQTTPMSWVRKLVGPAAASAGFLAKRPRTYEETVLAVREFCEGVAEAREKGDVDPDTTGFVVVDSIRKLVPKKLLDELMNELAVSSGEKKADPRAKNKGVDGFGGRAGQIKAALNAAWMDELIVLLAQTRCGMLTISRETEVVKDNPFAGGPDFKIGGGGALFYDSSLVVRTTRDSFLYERAYEANKPAPDIVGERISVEVHKTKLAGRDERWPTAYFHTSNGRMAPEGFDRVRDVLDLAFDTDVCQPGGGGWVSFQGEKLGQGMNNTLALLRERPETVQAIEAAIEAVDAEREAARVPASFAEPAASPAES